MQISQHPVPPPQKGNASRTATQSVGAKGNGLRTMALFRVCAAMIDTFRNRLEHLFLEAGLFYAHHRKPQWKNEIVIIFQSEPNHFHAIEVKVPITWKTMEEHDDRFVEATRKAIKKWTAAQKPSSVPEEMA